MTITLDTQFQEFHESNPHVYRRLEGLAAGWLGTHERVGMKMLWEVLRWQTGVQTSGKPWKLNNNYTSRYARLLADRHPDWKGRIHTRELKSCREDVAK